MKKLYTAILFLISNIAFGQTNVSGFINANTTWTVAGSPYHVIGNTILSHGYTLTIDPGVVVKFDTLKALQIDGELHAVGTSANRIIFTANSSTPVPGSWAKIQFSDTAVDAQFDGAGSYLSGCIMKYCDVSYGGSQNYGAISIATAAVCISNCRVSYSSYYGIFAAYFSKIDSCTVMNCAKTGIIAGGGADAPLCPYVFDHDSLISNVGGGMNIGIGISHTASCTGYSLIVQNCYFDANGSLSTSANSLFASADTALIKSNTFMNNLYDDLGSVLRFNFDGYCNIECNKFVNNHSNDDGPVIKILYSGNDTIRNNYFEGNTCSGLSPSFSSIIYLRKTWRDKIVIANNNFRNNITPNGRTIYAEGDGTNPPFISTFYIHDNNFIDEQTLSNIHLALGLTDFSLQFAHISNNNFINTVNYAIYNKTLYGGPNIDADSNYWGSTSTQHVDSAIYDYFDNSNSTVVYYSPILISPVETDTTCPAVSIFIKAIERQKGSFIIYPNPSHSIFTISFGELNVQNATLNIYDMTGREVFATTINSKLQTLNPKLSSGTYFVKVTTASSTAVQKLVIE